MIWLSEALSLFGLLRGEPLFGRRRDPEPCKPSPITLPKLSRTKIPTLSQLRRLSKTLSIRELRELGFVNLSDLSDDRGDLSPGRVLRVLQDGDQPGEVRHEVWKLATTTKDSEPIPKFECFWGLPAELRAKIWRYALVTERVVEFVWNWHPKPARHTVTFSCEPANGMALACRESREVMKGLLIKPLLLGTWLNPERDLIWFNMSYASNGEVASLVQTLDPFYFDGLEENTNNYNVKPHHQITKIMVTWQSPSDAMNVIQGLLENKNHGLNSLTFIVVEFPKTPEGELYLDDRKLHIEDLLDTLRGWDLDRFMNEEGDEDDLRRYIGMANRRFTVEIKVMQRGYDGPLGIFHTNHFVDHVFPKMNRVNERRATR